MKTIFTTLVVLAFNTFAYEPISTPQTPDTPRLALHSACVSYVLSSGSELDDKIDYACENMSSTIDIAVISHIAAVKPLTVKLIESSTDVPSFIELKCITETIANRGADIDASSIENCK